MKELEREISLMVESMREEIVSFIAKIVQIPSLPGEERNVQMIIADKLKNLNLEVDVFKVKTEKIKGHPAFCDDNISYENRICVVGRWKGTNKNVKNEKKFHSLILNGHMDVVSPGNIELWKLSPWSGEVMDGKIYGRGTTDMKAGFSAAVFAIEALQKLGFTIIEDLLIESVVGEETGGCGTLSTIIRGYTADAAIIMEPTDLKICPVQSGALSFRIKIKGKSIHACMKNKGVSAIEKFYVILNAINELERKRHLEYKDNSIYEDPMNVAPINVGVIRSGDWPSTVPDELIAEGRYGIFPGESLEKAKKVFENTIKAAAEDDDWLRDNPPTVEWFEGQFESGQTPLDEKIIELLSRCHKNVMGTDVKLEGVTYGSDLRLFTNHAKIPTVLYGPGNVINAHTVDEYISIDEVIKAIKVLALTIANWCGCVKNKEI